MNNSFTEFLHPTKLCGTIPKTIPKKKKLNVDGGKKHRPRPSVSNAAIEAYAEPSPIMDQKKRQSKTCKSDSEESLRHMSENLNLSIKLVRQITNLSM